MPLPAPLMDRSIKDALVQILTELTYGGEPAFVNVLDNTHDAFAGSPIARVLPDDYTSITSTNYQKDHTVGFGIFITWALEDPTDVEADKYNAMYDLRNIVVDALESGDHSGLLNTIDPSIIDWVMEVPRARTHVASGKGGSLLISEISVKVTYSQDIA